MINNSFNPHYPTSPHLITTKPLIILQTEPKLLYSSINLKKT